MGLTWCCCTASSSLCQACFGSTAPGTTGRKRSVLLLTIAIAIALWLQYSVGPSIVSKSGFIWDFYRLIPGFGKMVFDAWHGPCEKYADDLELLEQCAGQAGVYRSMATATAFFSIFAAATKINPNLNRQAWPAKYAIFLLVVAFTFFVPSSPLFTGVFLYTSRVGAAIFLVIQQIILIDIAYNWNEDWVGRAEQSDRFDYGSGSIWLKAIVATCVAFYIASFGGIYLLYQNFGACSENVWIISLTLVGILALTGIQLSGEEGSLLTSSVMSSYVVYLAYSMVSKNPRSVCNFQLGSNDFWGITVGLTFTAVSLAWIGLSWTAEDRLNVEQAQTARAVNSNRPASSSAIDLDTPFLDPEDQPTGGFVAESDNDRPSDNVGEDVWKLNVVLVLICCFVAMILTGWGTIGDLDENENAANPTVGRVNMTVIGLSQWLAIGLYLWTLVAPKMFPDREFS